MYPKSLKTSISFEIYGIFSENNNRDHNLKLSLFSYNNVDKIDRKVKENFFDKKERDSIKTLEILFFSKSF